jgi:DNA polymerase III alpha subunit
MMLNDYTEEEEGGEKTYANIKHDMPVTMGGMISAYKKLKTRTGSFMAFVTVEDMFGSIECVCFPKVYDKIRNFLEPDRVVRVIGKISIDADKAPVIICEKMVEFSTDGEEQGVPRPQAEEQPVKAERMDKSDKDKKLWLNVSFLEEEDVEELVETLVFYEGDTPVYFVKDGRKMLCSQKVNPGRALMAELAGFLSEDCIKLL